MNCPRCHRPCLGIEAWCLVHGNQLEDAGIDAAIDAHQQDPVLNASAHHRMSVTHDRPFRAAS